MRRNLIGVNIILGIILMMNIAYGYNQVGRSNISREKYKIGKSGLNRITMLPYKIVQIAGDNSQYKLKYDTDGSSIFIMPIVPVGEKIELTIRSDIGEIKDIELEVISGTGRIISLKSRKKLNVLNEQKKEIKQMISAMQKKEKGKYRVRKLSRNIKGNYGLNIKQIAEYKYANLSGAILEVSHLQKCASKRLLISSGDLHELMFSRLFSGTIATSIRKSALQESALVYVVTKGNNS